MKIENCKGCKGSGEFPSVAITEWELGIKMQCKTCGTVLRTKEKTVKDAYDTWNRIMRTEVTKEEVKGDEEMWEELFKELG